MASPSGCTDVKARRIPGLCQSLGWCRHQQQVPPLGISTMAWLSDFQWKQMSTLSLRRTYGTQFLAAEFYFIISSNLPLWSELGSWKGRGQLSGRVAWVPRIVPQTCLKMSVFRMFSASGFKKKWSVKIKVGMGRVWGRKITPCRVIQLSKCLHTIFSSWMGRVAGHEAQLV